MRLARRGALAVLTGAALVGPAAAQSWRTETVARQVRGEDRLAVDVRFSAGTVRIAPGTAETLYRAETHYDADRFEMEVRFAPTDRHLHFAVTPRDNHRDFRWDDESPQRLNLFLSPAVPLELGLEFGAASAEIDLGGLSLVQGTIRTGASASRIVFASPNHGRCRRLDVVAGAAEFSMEQLGNARCDRIEFRGGAGDLTLDFTGQWEAGTETRVDIGVGVAGLTLRLPTNVGVSVDLTRFLATFERSGFVKRGDRYLSPNFDTADARLVLDIRAALGDINVRWVEVEG